DRHAVESLAAAPSAPEVTVDVAAHAVGNPVAAIDEYPIVRQLRPSDHVEEADLAWDRPAHHDVELRLVGTEAEPVGARDVAGHRGDLARRAVDTIDVRWKLRRLRVAFVVTEDPEGRVAEPDRPVRLADQVVGRVQRLALIAIGHHGDGAVVLGPRDAA